MNKIKTFMAQKSIDATLGSDFVFKRSAQYGIDPTTMFYYQESGIPTLYYGQKPTDTTYMALSEETFNTIDSSTSTVRDNYSMKTTILNTIITANSIINKRYSDTREEIHPDALLLMVKDKEPGIEFNKFEYSGTNPIYNYVYNDIVSLESNRALRVIKNTESVNDIVKDFDEANTNQHFSSQIITTAEASAKKSEAESSSSAEAETPAESGVEAKREDGSSESEEVWDELKQLEGTVVTSFDNENTDEFFMDKGSHIYKPDSKRAEEVDRLASQVSSRLRGVYGRENTIVPSKRIGIRNFVRGSQAFYKKKRDTTKGKKIKLNIMVDCSGSMSGGYIEDAISVCMIFNKIAISEKSVDGQIILSAGEGSVMIKFGSKEAEDLLYRSHAFSGSEGIERTITRTMDTLRQSDYNICITDCQITDSKINKAKYEAKNIWIDGLYIKAGDSSKKKHIKHMEEFFSRANIVDNLEEAADYLVNVCLRS